MTKAKAKGNKKFLLTVLVEIVCLVLLGWFLFRMQTNLSVSTQYTNSEQKLDAIEELLDASAAEEAETIEVYDQQILSKADTAALLARTKKGYEYTKENAKALKEALNVYDVAFLDKEGNTLAEAVSSGCDYTIARFNALRTVFENGAEREPFNVTKDGLQLRYYSAKIDDETMVMVAQEPAKLYANLEETTSLASTLKGISVGLDGYAFAVSHLDYTFTYHPDVELVGRDALSAGIGIEQLQDEFSGVLMVDGEKLYTVGRLIGDNYIVCAVPNSEIAGSANMTVIVVLLAFFMVTSLIILYVYLLKVEIRDDEEKALALARDKAEKTGEPLEPAAEEKAPRKGVWFDKKIGKKIIPIGVVGLVAILLLSIYMQTLFGLSQQSVSNSRRVQDAEDTLRANSERVDELTEQCSDQYLEKCQAAAYVIAQLEEEQLTQEFMISLRDALQSYDIWYFDMNGDTIASDSDYWDYSLSEDPDSQSYEFRYILMGTTQQVIKDPQYNQTLGQVMQYIGTAVKSEEHHTTGLVQIGVTSQQLTEVMGNTDISSVLGELQIGRNGFAFAVNKPTEEGENPTFAYYPDELVIGKSVYDCGMEDYQLKDGYSDCITLNGTKYYCASRETEHYYVYVAVPYSAAVSFRLPVGLATTVAGLICLTVIILLLSLTSAKEQERQVRTLDELHRNSQMIDVETGDGRTKKTQSALSRWSYTGIGWQDKTAGQRLASIVRLVLGIVALVLVGIVVFPNQFFGENSLMHYILRGNWQKSLNIFALTSCALTSIALYICATVARKLLMWFSASLNAKGETICRMLDNFIKFAVMIGILYYCLSTIGVDTATLVASAGILSLIVGLGAQSLVNDILAGLFIVFEGEFQVGDIVTIGDFTGVVMEIGIRTTKVKGGGNVKVFANRNVTNVLNMTKDYSSVSLELNIADAGSLEHVEAVLAEELPKIGKHLPAIVEGPYYKGVSSLDGSSVNIMLTATCREKDKAQLERDLKRELLASRARRSW